MAYVLPLSANSPMLNPARGETPRQSCSSIASIGSGRTVQHNRLRSISTTSVSSVGSYFLSSFRKHNECPSTPVRSASSINFNKIRTSFDHRNASTTTSRRTSLTSGISSRMTSDSLATSDTRELRLVGVAESDCEPESASETQSESGDITDGENSTIQLALEPANDEQISSFPVTESSPKPALRKWVSRLRKKRQLLPPAVSPRKERWTLDDFDHRPAAVQKTTRSVHHKSDSQDSSLRFVTAMRSATATLASVSIATISRQTSKWRRGQQRGSHYSDRDPRHSADSARSIIDEAAKQRSRKRREKLEELIRTEENYVADLKALSHVYFTIVGHQPTSTSFARASAQKTIADVLQLHDEILGRLHNVVPFAEYDRSIAKIPDGSHPRSHTRWHSVDVVQQQVTPSRGVLATIRQGRRSLNLSRSSEEETPTLRCSPEVVAAVTRIFTEHIHRFKSYEEFGANFTLMQRDIDDTQRSIITWPEYDKAIEVLSAHVNPVRSREENRKKAMTLKDMLIKPIQRLPRYELLFNDLCTLTPVCDDPDAHGSVKELLMQLNGICQRVNHAKEDTSKIQRLETTWMIGNRMSFASQVPRSIFLQLLGQVTLCGCLYVAHRSKDRIRGSYVVCILFESTLVLATAEEDQPKYSILAGIALANATIEETDNQKGLQCHTAPHSWKIVFEYSTRMYEMIFVACSAAEAEVWRAHLAKAINAQAKAVAAGNSNIFELQSPLTLEMKSIGKAFGKPSSFVRCMSVHRAATVGPTIDLNQVIIKNTQAVKEVQEGSSQTSLQIPRSQSVQTPSHVQTLAPRRAERHRLESILSDVWSKGQLPFPGMVRRSDPIRASATHVIRKFSMASITSNFSASMRTASHTSTSSSRKEDVQSTASKSSRYNSRMTYPARPPLVNFHNAPDAFLPADFELQDPGAKRKRSAFRTLTMTMERPFSPLLSNENQASSLRRAQSVRDVTEGSQPRAPTPVTKNVVPEKETKKHEIPRYSIGGNGATTPTSLQVPRRTTAEDSLPRKTPRKSKSGVLKRLFG